MRVVVIKAISQSSIDLFLKTHVGPKTARVPHGRKTGFGHRWRKRAGTNQEFVPAPLRATSGRSSPPLHAAFQAGGGAQSSLRSRLRRFKRYFFAQDQSNTGTEPNKTRNIGCYPPMAVMVLRATAPRRFSSKCAPMGLRSVARRSTRNRVSSSSLG